MKTSSEQQPVRYRWVTGHKGAPFLPGALIGKLVVEPIVGRRGVTVAPEGLTVHKLLGARHIEWADVREVTQASSRTQGKQIVVVLRSDEQVTLPAPTSRTTGDVDEATRRIRGFVSA